MRFGAVVLAAGSSSRLGQPKQLLEIDGVPLVTRVTRATVSGGAALIRVVLGAGADRIKHALAEHAGNSVENANWAEGMGSSISVGVSALLTDDRSLDAILITVCDQIHFSSQTVAALAGAWRDHRSICAARYEGHLGNPVLFGRDYFQALSDLRGPKGAKGILTAHSQHVIAVDLPELVHDIDTPEDWRRANTR